MDTDIAAGGTAQRWRRSLHSGGPDARLHVAPDRWRLQPLHEHGVQPGTASPERRGHRARADAFREPAARRLPHDFLGHEAVSSVKGPQASFLSFRNWMAQHSQTMMMLSMMMMITTTMMIMMRMRMTTTTTTTTMMMLMTMMMKKEHGEEVDEEEKQNKKN